MEWFKVYYEARTDAKLKMLSDGQHRVWFNLMCYAAEHDGITPTVDRFLLAVEVAGGDTALLESTLELLAKLHIVEVTDSGISFVNFAKRQYRNPSDSPERVAGRVKKSRDNKKNIPTASAVLHGDATPCNANSGECNDHVTSGNDNVTACNDLDTDTEAEEDKETENDTGNNKKHYIPAVAATLSQGTPREKKKAIFSPEHMTLAERLKTRIRENKPDARVPTSLDNWADTIRLMIERDKRSPDRIAEIIDFCQRHSFWCKNILSADTLREKFDRLELEAGKAGPRVQKPELSGEAATEFIREMVG